MNKLFMIFLGCVCLASGVNAAQVSRSVHKAGVLWVEKVLKPCFQGSRLQDTIYYKKYLPCAGARAQTIASAGKFWNYNFAFNSPDYTGYVGADARINKQELFNELEKQYELQNNEKNV